MDKLSDWNRWAAQARVIPTPTTQTYTLEKWMTNCILKVVQEKSYCWIVNYLFDLAVQHPNILNLLSYKTNKLADFEELEL